MIKDTIKITVFVVLGLITIFPGFTQHPILNLVNPPADNTNWRTVVSIAQDQHGYIWIANQHGLHRYDGYNYISYYNDPEDSSSMAENRIVSMCISKSGVIWLGLWSKGLDRFDPLSQTFTHFSHNHLDSASLSNNTIPAMLEDSRGNLWVGTHGGLNLYHPEKGTFTHFKNIPGDTTSLSNNQVRVIYEDKLGNLWIGTGSPFGTESGPDEGGLNRFNYETGTFTRYMHNPNDSNTLIDNKVRAILEDSKGNFWVGTKGDGLHTMDRETGKVTRHTFDPQNPEKLSRAPIISNYSTEGVTYIHEDVTGFIWIGTFGSGVSRYNPETKKIIHYTAEPGNPIGLQNNFLYWAFTSSDGVLWISSFYSGNFYRTDPRLTSFTHVKTGSPTFGITEDSEGNIWVCTLNGVRIYQSVLTGKINLELEKHLPPSLKNQVTISILQDKDRFIWIGTSLGLWQKNPHTGKFKFFAHHQNDSSSIGKGAVLSIFQDREGALWVGTAEGGLTRMDLKTNNIRHYKNDPKNPGSLSTNIIYSIMEDKSGSIWTGNVNYGGINRLNQDLNSFKHYLNRELVDSIVIKNPQIFIYDIKEDLKGKIWAGSSLGLYFYDPGTDDFYIYKDTVTGKQILNPIARINMDKQNNLWIISNVALYKMNSDGIIESIYGKERGIDPGAITGLSSYMDKNGRLFIGDSIGFYVVNSEEINYNSSPPLINFTDFRLFNKSVIHEFKNFSNTPFNQTEKIELKHNQNTFEFDIVAIHYTNPAQNQQLYMLENYDASWKTAKHNFLASYYNVNPGKYILRVKAANSEGVWAEKVMDIIIKPPWWRTLLAYFVYAIIMITGIWWAFQIHKNRILRIEQVKAQKRELEHAHEIEIAYHKLEIAHENLKSAQSQLIHSEKMASLGQLTAGIAHEIQNPLNFVNNFSDVNKELLEELKEELAEGNRQLAAGSRQSVEEKLKSAEEIANDVIGNEQKISHHGRRAESIVKGMLLHSRGNSGHKELVDINALCDEYLRLSYHGFRAKDKSFNADYRLEADKSLPKIEVVPQDIGRVLLNLINNAFYAVDEKKKAVNLEGFENLQGLNYQPTVSVHTKKLVDKIEIVVKDNGNGISQNVLDKIFQPFFTTKPTGQGTGLGLSLAYDIVKAHGGEIKVESKEGEGSGFIINLPITT
jgi:ligand-binding sensor domain-containing protein/signal transduction histidine kinase